MSQCAADDHRVTFYEDLSALVRPVERFTRAGLLAGSAVVIAASQPHNVAIREALGTETVERAEAEGRLLMLDAHELLESIVSRGTIDEASFTATVGAVMSEVRSRVGVPLIRCFGEVVSLLTAEERYEEAIELEAYWDRYLAQDPFPVLCAYPVAHFAPDKRRPQLDAICGVHSTVNPHVPALPGGRRQRLAAEASSILHDLANVFTIVHLNLPTIIRSELPERSRQAVDSIGRACDSAKVLASRLRAVNRDVESAELRRLRANAVVSSVYELVGVWRSGRVGLELDPQDAHFIADKADLERVLVNLILNGLNAVGEDGRVTLRTRRGGEWLRIEVEDDGPGVPEDVQQRIFEPYFSTRKTGYGLGLAISRELVERNGGALELDSRPGRTIFTARFSLLRRDEDPANPPDSSAHLGTRS